METLRRIRLERIVTTINNELKGSYNLMEKLVNDIKEDTIQPHKALVLYHKEKKRVNFYQDLFNNIRYHNESIVNDIAEKIEFMNCDKFSQFEFFFD